MTKRQDRKENKQIRKALDRLATVDINQFTYTQVDLITDHLEAVRKIGYKIVARSGTAGYYSVVNRLHKDAVRRRRWLAEQAEMVA